MKGINAHATSSGDWRDVVAKNKARTRWVIFSFILIYLIIGMVLSAIINHPVFLAISLIFVSISIIIGITRGASMTLAGTNAVEVNASSTDLAHKQLYNIVEEMKIASSLSFMPKVYVLPVDYMNAFASGWNEKSALIAISKPLLETLTRDQLQAVVAHEMAHIRNQDIRLLLAVSVISNIALFVVDILFRATIRSSYRSSKKNDKSAVFLVVVLILRILLPIITAVLIYYLSRKREFMADAGCVQFTRDNKSLAEALKTIHKAHHTNKETYDKAYKDTSHESYRQLSYIFNPGSMGIGSKSNVAGWFDTHPTIEQRLRTLGYKLKPKK
jgi:heat shock protein HtpX